MANIDDLAAALNGHNVTDENGDVSEEGTTFEEEPVASEQQTTEDEFAEVESPSEEIPEAPQAESKSEENEFAEDETGKKYVPESRFKEVYGRQKALEREVEALRKLRQPLPESKTGRPQAKTGGKVDKAELLEVEMLYDKYPEFDHNSGSYNPVLDEMGYEIWEASGRTISRLEAARRATARSRALTAGVEAVRSQARQAKAASSDSGLTSRTVSRGETTPNPDNMSVEEMEAYLKRTGNW